MISIVTAARAGEKDHLCSVNKYNGKYVFWLNEPVENYQEVFSFKSIISICNIQSAQSEEVVKEAIVQSSMSDIDFDAVIVGTTEHDIAIRFKDYQNDNSIAMVKEYNGVPVFIDCNPLSEYSQEKRVKFFRRRVSKCYSSHNVAENLTKRGRKNDALIVGNDNIHWWIDFIN